MAEHCAVQKIVGASVFRLNRHLRQRKTWERYGLFLEGGLPQCLINTTQHNHSFSFFPKFPNARDSDRMRTAKDMGMDFFYKFLLGVVLCKR